MALNLLNLPHDVLASIFEYLSVPGLCALSCTCRGMRDMVSAPPSSRDCTLPSTQQIAEFGWTDYLRVHPPLSSYSLEKSRKSWDARTIARYEYFTERNWETGNFVARPLNTQWQTKLQPTLAINSSRLLVAAANTLVSYAFDSPKPRIRQDASWRLSDRFTSLTDVTALACTEDPDVYIVGMWDGSIKRIEIHPDERKSSSHNHPAPSLQVTTAYQQRDDGIESLVCEDNHLLSLTATGRATLRNLSSPQNTISSIELGARSWTSYLCTSASTPFAAFGTSSTSPLVLHRLLQDGSFAPDTRVVLAGPSRSPTRSSAHAFEEKSGYKLDRTHAATLSQHMREIPARPASSACYAITRAPPAAPWGASPELLVAGWYDGRVRLYDLRVASRYHYPRAPSPTDDDPDTPSPAPMLRPMLAMSDPWLYDPIYSVACGGGAGAHIAAGSARHGVVCLWDMRYATRSVGQQVVPEDSLPPTAKGLSVHAPGNDASPVYKLAFESSRLYGITDRRAFVFDWVSVARFPVDKLSCRQCEPDHHRRRASIPLKTSIPSYLRARASSVRRDSVGLVSM